MRNENWIIVQTIDPKYWDDGIQTPIGPFSGEVEARQYAFDKSLLEPIFFCLEPPID